MHTKTSHPCEANNEAAPPALPQKGQHVRNFLVIAWFQVVMRCGWIFKTESVIMPALLDAMGGSAWLRGCLPLINRFGQSVPPLLGARRIKVMPQKKWALCLAASGMGVLFLSLSTIWAFAPKTPQPWMPTVFLAHYAIFFCLTGINQLSLTTLHGKLIAAEWRGRLMTISNAVGATLAICAALYFLPQWLHGSTGEFHLIFGFAGICFVLAGIIALAAAEPHDAYEQRRQSPHHYFLEAWIVLRRDHNFRRLAIVAALFATSLILFPHYQSLGRTRLGLDLTSLVFWVVIQNGGAAVFSLVAGPLADRQGNRRVLQFLLAGIAIMPLLAIGLTRLGSLGESLFFVVFFFIGLTPVTMRILNNYSLEISDPADHTRYLSTLSLCMAAPLLLSPLVGLVIDFVGYEIVFSAVALLTSIAWLTTFRLVEPRHTTTLHSDERSE